MPGANVELLATFMSHAAVITWIKDARGRYLFASPAMERQMSKGEVAATRSTTA